jgi:hypothetical protein
MSVKIHHVLLSFTLNWLSFAIKFKLKFYQIFFFLALAPSCYISFSHQTKTLLYIATNILHTVHIHVLYCTPSPKYLIRHKKYSVLKIDLCSERTLTSNHGLQEYHVTITHFILQRLESLRCTVAAVYLLKICLLEYLYTVFVVILNRVSSLSMPT